MNNIRKFQEAILFKAMQDAGLESLTVSYSGGGDSGGVDDNDVPDSVANKKYPFLEEQRGSHVLKERTLGEMASNIAYDYMPSGFENNEGGYGSVYFNVANGVIDHNHTDYIEDTETDKASESEIRENEHIGKIIEYVNTRLQTSDIETLGIIYQHYEISEADTDILINGGRCSEEQSEALGDGLYELIDSLGEDLGDDIDGEYFTVNLDFGFTDGKTSVSETNLSVDYSVMSEQHEGGEHDFGCDAEIEHGIMNIFIKDNASGIESPIAKNIGSFVQDGRVCITVKNHVLDTGVSSSSVYYFTPKQNETMFSTVALTTEGRSIELGFNLDGFAMAERDSEGAIKNMKFISYKELADPDLEESMLTQLFVQYDRVVDQRSGYWGGPSKSRIIKYIDEFSTRASAKEVNELLKFTKSAEIKSKLESIVLLSAAAETAMPSEDVVPKKKTRATI